MDPRACLFTFMPIRGMRVNTAGDAITETWGVKGTRSLGGGSQRRLRIRLA